MENIELTKDENLRLGIANLLNFDIEKAQSVYDFVTAAKPTQKSNIRDFNAQRPDGVYYVLSCGSLQPLGALGMFKNQIVGVAVKMGDKVATVALHDAADGEEIALIKGDKCGSQKFFKPDFWDAISDYDGEANTKDYGDALNPEIGLQPGQYIPSCGQLHLILLNIKAVNEALEAVGGTPLCKDWYWSSTEYSAYGSWNVYFSNGYSSYHGKCYAGVVRPAVACQL